MAGLRSRASPIRLHDLRHGAASLMLAAGVDIKVVQETLGHVTSAYTRDTYTSVYPQLARDAAENTAVMIAPDKITTNEQATSKQRHPAG